jgi:type I restriction enzyme S subunit
MSEWRIMRVSELAVPGGLAGGPFGSSLVSRDYVPTGVPVIRGTNLATNTRYIGNEFVFVSPEKVERDLTRNIAIPGDVVFTQRGTLGQVGIVPSGNFDAYVVSQSQMRLRVDRRVTTPEFVYYAFRQPKVIDAIRRRAIATGVPHINLEILGSMTIDVPDLRTQQGITDVLGALDDKIAANDQLAHAAEKLTDLVAQTTTSRVVLQSLVSHVREQVLPANMNVDTVEHFSIPAYDARRLPEVVPPSTIKSNKFVVPTGAVLLSKLNPATPRVWNAQPSGNRPALASTEFLVLLPRGDISSAELWAVCKQHEVTDQIASKATGTSNSHQRARPNDILATEVRDPRTLSPDHRALICVLADRAATARNESELLAQVRDTLLPKLMSGEIRVREAEKVVEEML